ncbi:MAG: ZIP family metal transporter [Ilumatobacteraceae bacterium]
MSEGRTLLLGAIAGITILFGLPLGRIERPMPALRQFLNAIAVGILVFLVWDVFTHAWEPIDTALGNLNDHRGGLAPVMGYSALFFAGTGVGLISLAYCERSLANRRGPTVTPTTSGEQRPAGLARMSSPQRLSLMIAVGIGLHNFGEGLAIGASAGRNEISLATVLVIGFALHNATEGFGIVAPLTSDDTRPSWGFLLTMGTIGGAPTFVGTIVGRQFTSDAVSVVFLTLAAGSILYVVIQLLEIAHNAGRRQHLVWGVFTGLAVGFITDMIVTAGGA